MGKLSLREEGTVEDLVDGLEVKRDPMFSSRTSALKGTSRQVQSLRGRLGILHGLSEFLIQPAKSRVRE